MKNTQLLILFLLVSFCKVAFAQTPFVENFDELNQASPNQVGLGAFVNESTGTLQVGIPLLGAVSGDADVNLSLSYTGKGIKVNQSSGRVGLGWQLSGIGSITKVVCGLNDEGPNGYYQNIPNPGWRWQSATYSNINDYLKGFYLGNKDGQPDFFVLNIGNSAVKFIKKGNEFVTFPKTPVKIEFGLVDGINNSFKVTDEKGISYSFTEKEYAKIQQGSIYKTESVSSWFLTKIAYPNGQILQVTYSTEYTYSIVIDRIESETRLLSRQECPTNLDQSNSTINKYDYEMIPISSVFRTKRPLQIEFNQHRISFEYSDREDISGEKRLTMLSHYVSNNLVGGVIFNYSYRTKASGLGSGLPSKRLMLTGVQKFGKNSSLLQPQTLFYYNQIDLPAPGTPSQDLLGYYNNKSFQLVNPDGTFYSMLPATSYRIDVAGSAGYYIDDYPSLNRDPDITYTKAMVLEKVEYSSGKVDEFNYEPNSSSPKVGYRTVQDGLRIKQIISKSGSGDKVYTNYFYFEGLSYSLKDPNIKRFPRPVTKYAVPGVSPLIENFCLALYQYRSSNLLNLEPSILGDGVYYGKIRILKSSDELASNFNYVIEKEYQTEFLKFNFGGRYSFDPSLPGRLLKVTHYKADGVTKTMEELYEYETNFYTDYDPLALAFFTPKPLSIQTVSNPQDIYISVPGLAADSYVSSYQIDLLVTFSKLKSSEKRKYFAANSISSERIDYYYETAFSEKHFQPVRVTSTKMNGLVETGYFKYSGDFSVPASGLNNSFSLALVQLNSSNRLGFPVEIVKTTKEVNGQEVVISGTLNEYKVDPVSGRIVLAKNHRLKQIQALLVPNFTFSNYLSGSISFSPYYFEETQYNSYSSTCNLKEVKKGTSVTSFIYDQFDDEIIAECSGCTQAEIAYANFEDCEGLIASGNVKGNFLFNAIPGNAWPTAYLNTTSFTGSYSLNLPGVSISFNGTGLSTIKKYVLRFWSKNGSVIVKSNTQTLNLTNIGVINGWNLMEAVFYGGTTIEITGTGQIDQVLILKEGASVELNGFDTYYQHVFTSNGGLSLSRMEYDGFGRPLFIYDNEGNILKNFTYSIKDSY
ncbi:MAG: hypothetical protein L6Q78_15795 [Bacteroidia bacterium]|nr:hypothetical protein [Bacteroidia bacterium]